MIADLERFINDESPFWRELESLLDRTERDSSFRLDLEGVRRLFYLYQRASSDLARMGDFAADPELRSYLESLVARGFGLVHETGRKRASFNPLAWFFRSFPLAFRRHLGAFRLALAVMAAGACFGSAVVATDKGNKEIVLPFQHLLGSPSERVAAEEGGANRSLEGHRLTFSSQLMTNNTRVAVMCMALGVTFGVGTIVFLFYNGIILGAVIFDYVAAGQSVFLAGWLLPHGSVEIPAILVAGQAGFVLAGALFGRNGRLRLRERLRRIWGDLATLVGGVGVMLVWAGLVEALFSQYHEPVLPYGLKIAFGSAELALLALFLGRGGRGAAENPPGGRNDQA